MNNNYRFGGSGGAGGVADGRQERVKLLFANRQREWCRVSTFALALAPWGFLSPRINS